MYQITKLSNGLNVATEFLPGVESIAVAVTAGVGARYEEASENGISHLLEHMAFKGTKKRTSYDIAEAFDNVGGQMNAYTSMELTVYYAKVLKKDTRLAVDILGDIIQNSTFEEDELKREKDVVIQEIAMHHDTPDDLIMDLFDEAAFPDQPMGRSILSTEDKVLSYTRDDLFAYLDKHYRTPRMVLSAAGAVDHDAFVKLAEEYFTMKESKAGPGFITAHYQGGEVLKTRKLEQLHVVLGLPAPDMHTGDYYTLQLYSNILGGGMSSRLFQEVREKRGLAYSVYSMGASYEDCGVMSVFAATTPEKASQLCDVLADQISSMGHEVSDLEFERAKNQQKAELLMAREGTHTVATWIGRHLLMFGEYRDAKEVSKRIDAVKKADILRIGKNIASGTPTVAALGDIKGVKTSEALCKRLRA